MVSMRVQALARIHTHTYTKAAELQGGSDSSGHQLPRSLSWARQLEAGGLPSHPDIHPDGETESLSRHYLACTASGDSGSLQGQTDWAQKLKESTTPNLIVKRLRGQTGTPASLARELPSKQIIHALAPNPALQAPWKSCLLAALKWLQL